MPFLLAFVMKEMSILFKFTPEWVGAIGQWVGAIATFLAVVVALKQIRPKIKVQAYSYILNDSSKNIINEEHIQVTITNIGAVPVTITQIAVMLHYHWQLHFPETISILPRTLNPTESICFTSAAHKISDYNIKEFDLVYTTDSTGRVYFQQVGLLRRLSRVYQWRYGKIKHKNVGLDMR